MARRPSSYNSFSLDSLRFRFGRRPGKPSAPARADGAIQWLGVGTGYNLTEYRGDDDNSDKQWDHRKHWFPSQDEEIEQGEDDKHVGEVNFVAALAEIS